MASSFPQNFPSHHSYQPEALIQTQDNLDYYFMSNLPTPTHYSFMPRPHLSRCVSQSQTDATRLNTEATMSSNSTSPSLNTPYSYNFGLQREANLQDQTPFTVFLDANNKISSHHLLEQENVTDQFIKCNQQQPSQLQEDKSPSLMDDLEDDDDEVSLPQISKKSSLLPNDKFWNEEMDVKLLKLGAQYKSNWKRVAKKFDHKRITATFVKDRYKELLDEEATTKRIKFNHREDLMIAKYYDRFGSNWTKMAPLFPDRTPTMLKNRYYSFIRKRNMTEMLLEKVKEIESDNNHTVDKLDTPEAEKYTECMDLRKEKMPKSLDCILDLVQAQHLIFGLKESIKPILEGEDKYLKQEKEIQFLKSRIKSLQSLFLQTRTELQKLKDQK